jgi:hypothetical protein
MNQIIADISLSREGNKVKIIPSYSIVENSGYGIETVLIEKYELALTDENLVETRKAIDIQQVLQYSGINTAYSSKLFHSGGSQLYKEPYLIPITYGVERSYDYFIDDSSDIDKNIYVYRILNYGKNSYESATQYVAGLINDESYLNSKNLYHNYLDKQDFIELLPEGNIEALRYWIRFACLFHENYKLRFFGEVEDFKFNVHLSRTFLNMYFFTELMQRIEMKLLKTEENIYALST